MSRKLWRSGEKTNFHRKELFLKPAGTAVVVLFTLRSFLKYGLQAESTTLCAEYCVSSHERVTSMKSSSSFRLLKDKKFLIDISMISLLTFSWYFYLCFISLVRIFEWTLSRWLHNFPFELIEAAPTAVHKTHSMQASYKGIFGVYNY